MPHPWHGISPGPEAPDYVNALIEIPRGSKAKYELDKTTGYLKLDRVLYSSVHYPANYGFIPQTYCDDQDPLDILVLCSLEIQPMCLVEAQVVGVMHMHDNQESDDKIIAVARHDMSVSHIRDISELGPHIMIEIQRFFEDYKALEHKQVSIENLQGRAEALEIIRQSMEMYQEHFCTNREIKQ
ncbi:MAG: inorganic pyrophosphatase [Candidatus Melainabacteria bacterium HGW-Melainabacteria-1]|nr:MAG: inorganic pyrophosphatase [Candidatus Melainabacteria bacterium HGW-Melainabacteria-1]